MANKTNKNVVYRAIFAGGLLGFLAGILAITLAIAPNASHAVQVSHTSNSLSAANTNAAFQNPITIYNNQIAIAPAYNRSICNAYGCSNYTQAENFTFTTSLNGTGYLEVTIQGPANLTISTWETYAPNIPQNGQYYNTYLQQIVPSSYTESLITDSIKHVIIPVLPGNFTLKVYNFNSYGYYGDLNVSYVTYKVD